MFDPGLPLFIHLLSLFHVVTPPLLLWAIRRLGYDRRGWKLQTLMAWIVVPVNYFWRPQQDVNWARGIVLSPAAGDAGMGLSTRLSGNRSAVGLFSHSSFSRLADAALAALAPASAPAVPRASGAAAAALSVYFGGLPGCFRTADSGCGYSIDPLKDEMSSSWKSGKGNCLPSRSSAIFLTAWSAFSSWTPVSRLR
jgi:hypothetical protein